MINLSPINKKIRETLAKRSQSQLRDSFTDPLAPIDSLVNTTSRSIWVKMFSPVITKKDGKQIEGARIFGGEVLKVVMETFQLYSVMVKLMVESKLKLMKSYWIGHHNL